MNSFPYYKSIDGIRGIAVLMVLLIHNRLLPIGWVGIQIFFVVSGFLITGILLTQTDRPFAVYVRRFYWRRSLRILPLYFLFLALCSIAFIFIQIPETLPKVWLYLVTFTYDIFRIPPQFPDSSYFGHFWTLCIEEQFYLVWPFIVFLLPVRRLRQFVFFLILAGPLIRFVTALCFANYFTDLHFVQRGVHSLPTSHLDAFAAGALLAVLPDEWRQKIAPKARLIFLGMLFLTISAGLLQAWWLWRHHLPPHWLALGYDSLEYFHQSVWAYSLLNLTSLCLIFCAIEDPVISKALAGRVLVFVGTISYGLYVWHLPVLAVFFRIWPATEHSASGFLRFMVFVPTALAIAVLSYFCYERYFLKMKNIWHPFSKSAAMVKVQDHRAHETPN